MRIGYLSAMFVLSATAVSAAPQSIPPSPIWTTQVNQNIGAGNYGDINTCWSLAVPGGSSDFVSVSYNVVSGIPNTTDLADGLPVTGLGASLCLGNATYFIPRIGLYYPLPSSPNTPDLNNPVVELWFVTANGPSNGDFFFFDTNEFTIAPGTPRVIEAMQFPVGFDPTFQVGADASTSTSGTSYYSDSGFQTPPVPAAGVDIGLVVAQDNAVTTSCSVSARLPHGRLRVSRGNATSGIGNDPLKGDRLIQHVVGGDTLHLSFFGPQVGDVFIVWLMTGACTPITMVSSLMTTVADPDGDGCFRRLNASWPASMTGSFDFGAFWGNASCSPAVVGFTNCVTVMSP
jgi:hypothetical protein